VALRNAQAITIRPNGLSDAIDGTNAFEGAMASLQNLVPSYSTQSVFVPRPAAIKIVDFGGDILLTEDGIPIVTEGGQEIGVGRPDGVISALLVVGSRAYGMIGSTNFPGQDEPFCYDFALSAFIAISGLDASLLPTSQPTTGDWTPPTMNAVTNSLILVTHPGFPGAPGPVVGWLDISNFSSNAMLGDLTTGSPVITSLVTTVGVSAPILQGVIPGQSITGPGIPNGTYVKSATNGTFSLNTTGNTYGPGGSGALVDNLGSTTGVLPGMVVTGPAIPTGAYVVAVLSSTSVVLSTQTLAPGTAVAINFSGGGTITMSQNATATASLESFTVTGGTPAAPLWGAGNTNTNPLSIIPTCAYGFNGRCYYGLGPYLVYSDPLNPLQVSLASQALVIGDPTSITALVGTPLTSQLTGGVQQSLTVFKGAGSLYQITGDAATHNLAQNIVNGSVGTLAPRSIVATPLGIAYMALDGLRMLGLTGTVTPPIGTGGTGIALPFLNALFPSRMSAAYAEGTYRVTVQRGDTTGNPIFEYWIDIDKSIWTGPHTFPTTAAAPAPPTPGRGTGFLVVPVGIPGSLWLSDNIPDFQSTYLENGQPIECVYKTCLLPDNGQGFWNRASQMSLAMALTSASSVEVIVVDDTQTQIGKYDFSGFSGMGSLWGGVTWGSFLWGAAMSPLREYAMRFAAPMFFRQAAVSVTFEGAQGQAIGNLYCKIQPIGLNVPFRF
jgi:hypothetical protein